MLTQSKDAYYEGSSVEMHSKEYYILFLIFPMLLHECAYGILFSKKDTSIREMFLLLARKKAVAMSNKLLQVDRSKFRSL